MNYVVLVKHDENGKTMHDPLGIMEVCEVESFVHLFGDLKKNSFLSGSNEKQMSFTRTLEWLKVNHPDLLL
jgi:hypothetical protein